MTFPSFIRNRQGVNAMLHVLVWAAVASIPWLLNGSEEMRLWVIVKRSWLPLFFSAVIFYINYFRLVDRLLFRNRVPLFIVTNVLLIAGMYWGNVWVKDLFPPTYVVNDTDPVSISRVARIRELARFSSIVSFVLAVVLCVVLKMAGRWFQVEADKERSDRMLLEAELIHLRYQLQPHFFFNSLNNIYALIDKSPEGAKGAVHSLGKLMRYLLYETGHDKVRLSTEIDFLKRYIGLMQLRLTPNVTVVQQFPPDSADYAVAPLLFISLVENAFKHGVPLSGPASIVFRMEADGHRLLFTTENINAPKDEQDKSGSGIGLENLRKRLELLYPGKHSFATTVEDGVFRARLEMEV
jgi:hypothetical protein